MYLVALHYVITQLGLFLFLQKYAFYYFGVLQCAAVRPVVVCGSLRWSAVVCGFQTYPDRQDKHDRQDRTMVR